MAGRSIRDILGSAHINGKYNFTDDDVLNEGAQGLLDLGSRVIKVIVREDLSENYPFNSQWQVAESLVEVAETTYFRKLFSKPFSAYILMAFAPGRPFHYFLDGMTSEDVEDESRRMYEFAKHLLTTYRGTGKTFVIQNWESDWTITPPLGPTTPIPSKDPDEVSIRGMIDWFNARQDGVERARRDVGTDGVMVAHAAEVNLVDRAMSGENRVTNCVVPYTHCDLYSYSAWDTLEDPAKLRAALDYLCEKSPDSDVFGHRNVYVGEYGAAENVMGGPEKQLETIRNATETILDWGALYAAYWDFYCDGPVREYSGRPRNDDMSGWWLIRPDGTKPPVWDYFHDLLVG